MLLYVARTTGFLSAILGLELQLELDASVNPSHPTDDIGEKSSSLYISPFVSKMAT